MSGRVVRKIMAIQQQKYQQQVNQTIKEMTQNKHENIAIISTYMHNDDRNYQHKSHVIIQEENYIELQHSCTNRLCSSIHELCMGITSMKMLEKF